MARARNIKPGFFKNEDLAECSLASRLCFAGLWTLADREGRLEDRPKRIKAELFAFDSIEVEPLLRELEAHKFILRYDAGGLQAVQILKFTEHQTPHYTEKPSVIMAPQLREFERIKPDKPPDDSGLKRHKLQEDSRSEAGLKGGSLPPESRIMNHESGINTSGTSYPHHSAVRLNGSHSAGLPKPEAPPDCPQQRIRDLWAELMPELQQPVKWTPARATTLRARWREEADEHSWAGEDDGLKFFAKLFRWCRKSDFLMGRAPARSGATPFSLTVPWLIKAENWAKVQEGNYHEGSQ